MREMRYTTLGRIVRLKRGYDLPTPDRRPGTIPVLGSFGITGSHNVAKLSGPGVTIGRSGASIGVATWYDGPCWPLNTALYAQDFLGNDPRYVYYLLKAIDFGAYNSGSAQPSLNRNYLEQIPVAEFGLDDQRRISGALGAIEDLIENNRRRVEVLEGMARTIYREWFMKFRYPGYEDVPLVDSALGPIPSGWEHTKLYDAAEVGFGFSFKSPRFAAQGSRQIIRIRDIPVGISSTFTDEAADTRYAVHDDDVLIGMDGDFHMTVWTGGDAWLNQRVTRLRPRLGMSPLHLLLAIEGQIVEWNRAIVGTTVAHLGKKHLELVTVLLPDSATLERASEIFGSFMGQRRCLEQSNRRLAGLRDLLLPKLVTGQIDVSALDLDALIEGRVA
jgi:type I restriction enzyme S subunit